jgi:hypothetical protein
LKPGNIMVSSDGYAKVLDFGLAKLTERAAGDADLSAAPTITAGEQTSEGVVVGTVGYMAPEQVRGQAVDARADVFAFGCMLYEAATRRRPFAAESDVETMHRILHDVPAPVEELNPEAPAELRRLIRRCLAKDPNHRPQSMRDLALGLREIVEEYETLSLSSTVPNDPAQRRRPLGSRLAWIVAGIATAVALGALLLPRMTGRAVKAESQRFAVSVPGLKMGGSSEWFAISPDGRTLVFLADDTTGRSQLWIRPLASLEARPLEGTDTGGMPFWSPDSRWIGFFADQKLRRVAIGGEYGGASEALATERVGQRLCSACTPRQISTLRRRAVRSRRRSTSARKRRAGHGSWRCSTGRGHVGSRPLGRVAGDER